jgi:hypothetical protein
MLWRFFQSATYGNGPPRLLAGPAPHTLRGLQPVLPRVLRIGEPQAFRAPAGAQWLTRAMAGPISAQVGTGSRRGSMGDSLSQSCHSVSFSVAAIFGGELE